MMRHIMPDVVSNQTVQFLSPNHTAYNAATLMADHNISAILVTSKNKLAGIITERDLTQRIISKGLDPKKTPIKDFMTTDINAISPNDTPQGALDVMNRKGFRHLPILDGEEIVGIVSARDLYAAIKLDLEDDMNETSEYMFGCSRYTN